MDMADIEEELLASEEEFPILEVDGKIYALDPGQNLVTVAPGSVII